MSVSIKLSRVGAKKSAFYRVIIAPTRSKVDGKNLDIIGSYDPKEKTSKIDKKKFDDWVKKGAIVTSGVKKVLELKK
ncbi:MAG: 30S ribosomal protein S16 [bacterium]|nr:MAG: 30S ribosomal protein S16 [bacterium]